MVRTGVQKWRWPQALSSLSHSNYRLFWAGYLVTLTGVWIQRTAQQWLAFRLTGSALSLGVLTFASFLPMLLLGPVAGVVADRVNKRKLVTVAQVAFMALAACQAGLTLTGLIDFGQLLVLTCLLGLVETFETPARQSFIIEMVGREDLPNAIALNISSFQAARVVGPAISGLIIGQAGEGVAFAINAVGFSTVIASLLMLRLPFVIRPSITRAALDDLREGVQYVLRHRVAVTLVGLVGAQAFLGLPYLSLLPIFAGRVLKVGPSGLGLLMSAVGVGALAGAATLAVMSHSHRKGLLVTVGMLLFALGVSAFSFSTVMPLSLLALVLVGWAQVAQLATTNALLQSFVPDVLRGRVMSLYFWMNGGLLPLGALFFGALAEQTGAPAALLAGAMSYGVLAAWAAWRIPELRNAG